MGKQDPSCRLARNCARGGTWRILAPNGVDDMEPSLHATWWPACARAVFAAAVVLACSAVQGVRAQEVRPPRNDYPTAARADYVIGCMAANGFKRELLDRCACGIDTIANLMSYDDYEKASTILSMQQAGVGPRGGLFRDTPVAKDEMQKLRRAQAEVILRCG
jgi:hypothetical protein